MYICFVSNSLLLSECTLHKYNRKNSCEFLLVASPEAVHVQPNPIQSSSSHAKQALFKMLQSFGFLYRMDTKRSTIVSLVICFLLASFTRIKGFKDPRAHPNLSPVEWWHSAYDCLQNTSSSCPANYQLTLTGWVNVKAIDTGSYCNGGCANHTKYVLKCLEDVMEGKFKFEDAKTVKDISYTITQGCSSGFTGKALSATSSARMVQVSKTSALASVALLSIYYQIM